MGANQPLWRKINAQMGDQKSGRRTKRKPNIEEGFFKVRMIGRGPLLKNKSYDGPYNILEMAGQ